MVPPTVQLGTSAEAVSVADASALPPSDDCASMTPTSIAAASIDGVSIGAGASTCAAPSPPWTSADASTAGTSGKVSPSTFVPPHPATAIAKSPMAHRTVVCLIARLLLLRAASSVATECTTLRTNARGSARCVVHSAWRGAREDPREPLVAPSAMWHRNRP